MIPWEALCQRRYRLRQAMPFRLGNASDINVHLGPCIRCCWIKSLSSSRVHGAERSRAGEITSFHRFAICSSLRPGMRDAEVIGQLIGWEHAKTTHRSLSTAVQDLHMPRAACHPLRLSSDLSSRSDPACRTTVFDNPARNVSARAPRI